jgi:hypothetical protein
MEIACRHRDRVEDLRGPALNPSVFHYHGFDSWRSAGISFPKKPCPGDK